jgi:hypothetical protein
VKVLVITSEAISAAHLREALGSELRDDVEVLVIAPALHDSVLRFWVSDADEAIAKAAEVAQASVDRLDSAGVAATGDTGESEPMAAIADSLQGFAADRVLLFIHPEPEQAYREGVTAQEITERFGLPVTVREIAR